MKEYNITVDEGQLKALLLALNTTSRIQMGQLDVLMELVPELTFAQATQLKRQLFPDFQADGESMGIRNPSMDDSARKQYELYHVIQKYLAETEDPDGPWNVYRGPVVHLSESEKLPVVKKTT